MWVNVADYVDKKQVAHSNLDKGGYVNTRKLFFVLHVKHGFLTDLTFNFFFMGVLCGFKTFKILNHQGFRRGY